VARGNNFTLIVELQQLVISDEGKEITTQIEGTVKNVNICPSNAEPVEWNDWQMAQTSNGAAVAISIPSTQPLGAYGIEITGTRTGGGAFRWYAKPGEGFIIVDASSDNFLTDMVRIYTITGIVGVGSSSSGDGGGATGTLNTSNSTAQTPQSGESFGGNINLHKVSKTGSYNDLLDKPTIPDAQVQADWNQTTTTAKDYIKNKPTIPDAQVQADWNQTTTTAKDYIKNKPTIPSLSGYATQQWVGQQGFLTQHQSLVNYEKKMGIAGTPTLVNNTLTIPVSQLGSYYRLVVSAPTTITLPDMAN
jgi:uncharacterized protein (DUF736 family)